MSETANQTYTSTPPRCPIHGESLVLFVYDRPGSPPGNGWDCKSCAEERRDPQLKKFVEIIREIKFPDFTYGVELNTRGEYFLQGRYKEADTVTGKVEMQYTRKWLLSPQMTKSEVVQTAFKCILTSMEHRTREWFKYRGKAIFGPHFDVDKLHEIAGDESSFDGRKS